MSMSFPGVPIGPEPDEARSGLRIFTRIPRLRDHLGNGGWPGVTYAQVAIRNLKAAADRTQKPAHLRELRGGAIYFTIEGPKGRIDCALIGTGKPIPGAQPDAGNRLFFTDGEIGEATGLSIQYPIWLTPRREHGQGIDESPRRTGAAEGRESHARAQGREPSQRQRSESQVEASGHSHRDVGGRSLSQEERLRRSERMKEMWRKRRAKEAARKAHEAEEA